jgi:hypothetical protein
MLGGSETRSDLLWFYGLAMDDQVAFLRDPHQPVRREVAYLIVARIGKQPAIRRRVLRRWASNDDACWTLAEPSALLLCNARKKLDAWWNSASLTDKERGYLIQHRGDDEPPAHAVMVESGILRAFLEMKAA